MVDRRFLDISLVVEGIADEPEKFDVGTQYIVGENPTADFENAEPTQIARYDGEKWIFITPKETSLEVINAGSGEILKFDGMLWEVVAVLSSSGGGSGSSLLVVDDLAQVLTSADERPNDYVLNYCIVDNGINTPKAYGYYAHDNAYSEMYFYNSYYGYEATKIPVNSVLVGDNGKYYTLKTPALEHESLIEASEIAVGTLVLNKKCNLFYLYDGTELKLVGGNFIGVDYAGVSDVGSKWSDTDYWKHFGEVGLYISNYDMSGELTKPNATYKSWNSRGITQPQQAGALFASTNHCVLYHYDGKYWNPVTLLKKGTAIYSSFDDSIYISNGAALKKKEETEKFIAVKDICDVSEFGFSGFPSKSYAIGSKCLANNSSDIGVYVRYDVDEYTNWEKYSDVAYGDKFIVLEEVKFSNNEPCIHEYVKNNGNVLSYFNRYNLFANTLIFNCNDNTLYYYDGKNIQSCSENTKYTSFTDIVLDAGKNLPTTATTNDKFLKIDEGKIYTATAENTWDSGIDVNRDKDVFISKKDFKIYKNEVFNIDDETVYIFLPLRLVIPKGYTFLNEADNKMYYFNGTEFVALSV